MLFPGQGRSDNFFSRNFKSEKILSACDPENFSVSVSVLVVSVRLVLTSVILGPDESCYCNRDEEGST